MDRSRCNPPQGQRQPVSLSRRASSRHASGNIPAAPGPHQHPPGENPSISVKLAEPPSVDGTGGGQIVDGVPGAAAVALAACVEVPRPSPDNCRGAWELATEEALIP